MCAHTHTQKGPPHHNAISKQIEKICRSKNKGLLRVVRREYLGNQFKIWILEREREREREREYLGN